MVFQNYALYPQMTVRENMAFGLKIRKFNQSEVDSRVLEASDILQIQNLLDRSLKSYLVDKDKELHWVEQL